MEKVLSGVLCVYSALMSKDRASSEMDFGIRVGAVVEREGALLLVRHEKPGQEPYWVLPGGRLEPGETIPECAEREVQEETSLEGRFIGVLYVSEFLAEGRHTVDVTVRVEVSGGEAQLGSDPEVEEGSESTLKELRWVTTEELEEISLLPGWIKERLLEDAGQGWLAGEVYLGSGTDA
jgi:ADP-ribose pyrophosphatase YjhB (NUDIX family)